MKLKIVIYPKILERPAVRRIKLYNRLAERSRVSLKGQGFIGYMEAKTGDSNLNKTKPNKQQKRNEQGM